MPLIAFADTVLIRGIYFNLDYENNTAEVTSNPQKYTGYVTIPDYIRSVDNLYYCVTAIGEDAFNGCVDLSHVDIPNTVISIGNRAFRGCRNILSISIPESIESIGAFAFDGCGFQHVLINDLVAWCNIKFDSYNSNPVSCSNRVYLYGEDIIDLEIPEEITAINDYAFCNFTYLKSVILPNSVRKIGCNAFANSKNLVDINLSENIMYIGADALKNTKWYEDHSDGVVYAGLHAYKYKGKMPVGTNIEISEGTKSIVGSAFSECKELCSVIIPNSVEAIGDRSFEHCINLDNLVIPSGIKTIGSYAFFDCISLSNIEIGSGLITINESAFGWCPNLCDVICMSVNVPNASENSFDGSLDNSILYVPALTINEYKHSKPWNKFKKILTLDGEDVEEMIINDPILSDTSIPMRIFSVDGKLIEELYPGIHIVHLTNRKSIKVIIK